MSSNVESRWPGSRWWFLIGVIFCAQAGLVFWLGETSLPKPRSPARTPLLRFAGPSSEAIVSLSDPTLFALPHWQAFAGEAWLQTPPPPLLSLDWAEKPLWLALPTSQLGQLFGQFAETNLTGSKQSLKSDAALKMPVVSSQAEPREPSRVRVAGELTQRLLLTALDLPTWPHNDTLTNTVVSVVVKADGQVLSADVVSGSGLLAADRHALSQAVSARFDPLERSGPNRSENPLTDLTWGNLVFEWRTLPLPMTNALEK